jgi:hypothetical protein
VRPQDGDRLRSDIERMSDESLYRRFFISKRHFTEEETTYLLDIDFVNHVALMALAEEAANVSIRPEVLECRNVGPHKFRDCLGCGNVSFANVAAERAVFAKDDERCAVQRDPQSCLPLSMRR